MSHVDLKILRKGKKLTQQQVADLAGISRPYYTMLENDKKHEHSPKIEIVIKLADVLGFSWEEYFEYINK